MSEKKSKYNYFGTIRKGDNGLYIKIEKDITFKEGMNITLEKPDSYANYLLEKGEIDEQQHEELLAKIPEWKKYNLKIKN